MYSVDCSSEMEKVTLEFQERDTDKMQMEFMGNDQTCQINNWLLSRLNKWDIFSLRTFG